MPSTEDLLGSIDMWCMDWPPRNWALCNGQILQVNQNQALYALLGNYYGGNGSSTFALPDMRGRVPVGMGQGPGLPNYNIGQMGGEVEHTLITSEIPVHNHVVACNDTASGRDLLETPVANIPAKSSTVSSNYSQQASGAMADSMVASAGNSLPHQNVQPFLAVGYIIALQGIFPSRD